MAKKKLLIFPFNGNGIEALDCISFDDFELIGFVDDDLQKKSDQYDIYTRDILKKYEEFYLLAVPGSAESFRKRKEIINSLGIKNVGRYITAIHPNASIGRNVEIGANCLIMAGVVITSNARIGDHVCILPNSIVHHDSVIGEYTLIGSKVVVAGGTFLGENCYVGSGSNIMNGLYIGNGSLIGMGSNVLSNVENNTVVAGNPARNLNIKRNEKSF